MKYRFLTRVVSLLGVAVAASAAACSSSTAATPVGPPACDPTQCAPKNECIPDAMGVSQCRIGCMAHTDCPFNTYCMTSSPRSYCVKLATELPKKPTGQWGTPCLPQGGLDNNPACDSETGFKCYGAGTTDALAYCTQYECAQDLDCAGGFYCATINNAPNVKTDTRSFGKVRNVCLKRGYCSPCASDIDCPVIDGKQSLCTEDDLGGRYCSTPCAATSNCRLDAACNGVALDGATKVCRPRAGVCKGDGSICSPCLADTDCPNGFCIKGAYSPERFCSVKSTKACAPSGTATIVKGECPAFTAFKGTQIGCEASSSDENIPKDQCIGLIDFGDSGDIACYTKH